MKLMRDTWLMFQRYMTIFLHNPTWVIIGLAQPILYLLLFAPLLKGISSSPGFPQGGAYNVFVPGLLIQLGLFGASAVGFGLISELRDGVVERFRVTPVSRFALLLGHALRDVTVLVVQATILLLISIPFGLHATFAGAVIMLALVGLIGLGISSIAYSAALALRNEDSYAPLIFTVSLPLLLLSGVLLPLTFAPKWLQTLAYFNPLSYAVKAARDVFNGHSGYADVYIGLAVMLVLAATGVVIGARSFKRAAT